MYAPLLYHQAYRIWTSRPMDYIYKIVSIRMTREYLKELKLVSYILYRFPLPLHCYTSPVLAKYHHYDIHNLCDIKCTIYVHSSLMYAYRPMHMHSFSTQDLDYSVSGLHEFEFTIHLPHPPYTPSHTHTHTHTMTQLDPHFHPLLCYDL